MKDISTYTISCDTARYKMDVSKVSNTSVDELYGDIDDMYVSQSSCVPNTESDGSVVSSITLCTSEEPSSTILNGTDQSNITEDAVNVTDRNSESNADFDDDDFNLYDETIGVEHQYKTDTYNELKKQCEALMSRLSHLETENQSLHMKFDKTEQENVEAKRNIARLLLTTKGEIGRKDKEIATLRKRLSVSPRGKRRMFDIRAGSAVASSSLSSVDSDFDPLCVSSPGRVSTTGKSNVPQHASSRFQPSKDNVISPLAKDKTDRASNRVETSTRPGRLDTIEIAGIESDESGRSVGRHSRSHRDSDNLSKDKREYKSDKFDIRHKGNDKRSDSSNKTDKTKDLEDERKRNNSNSERGRKKESESIHKLDRRKEYVSSSDRDTKDSERKERSDKMNRTDRARNRSGDIKRKNVNEHSEKDRSYSTDINDKQERTKLNAKCNVKESTSANTAKAFESVNNKQRERKKSGIERVQEVDVSAECSVERGLEHNDRTTDLKHSVKSRIQILSHDDTKERENSSRQKERDRNKSGDDRKMRDLESNSEGVESKNSGTKAPVLDLREKLRLKRLKASGYKIFGSPERVSENTRNRTKTMEITHVKDSICETKKVSDSKFLNANDILESCVNKESFSQDVDKYKPEKDTKSKYLKGTGKTELNGKPKNSSKKNISEDLEFLNKLKSSIRKESPSTLSSSKTTPAVSVSVNCADSDMIERKLGDEISKDTKELGELTDDSDDGVEGTFSECDDSSEENDDIVDTDNRREHSKQDDNIVTVSNTRVQTHIENIDTENKDQALIETPISNCEINSCAIQTVCNKQQTSELENNVHVQAKREIPSQNHLTEKTSEKSQNINEATINVKACQDIDTVSSRTDIEECFGSNINSSTSQDSDQSESCAGVSSETISSCTSTHMSKSVMEYFQALEDRPDNKSTKHTTSDMCSKSNTSHMDKPSTCTDKNCSIKMRHLHPKQSNKTTVCEDSDRIESQCTGVENTTQDKTVSTEPCADKSSVINDEVINTENSTTLNRPSSVTSSNTIERSGLRNPEAKSSGSAIQSSHLGRCEVGDTNKILKIANQTMKASSDDDNTHKLASNAPTGNHKEDVTLKTHSDATIGTSHNKASPQYRLEMNKPDVTDKMSQSPDMDVCDSVPDVEMGDPDEEIAENESDGSFGSNIVSEKTESLQSSDETDDSCSTCSDDSTSDGDVSGTDSSIDDTDYVTTDSHTSDSDENNDLSYLEENEKLSVKSTSSAACIKPTSDHKSDNPAKDSRECKVESVISDSAIPEGKLFSGEVNKSVQSKKSFPEAINVSGMVNVEHDSVSKNSENVKILPQPLLGNKKIGDVQSRKSHSAIEIKTVESSSKVKNIVLAESEKRKSGIESSPNTRSNMLQQLLHCVEKEVKGRSPESVNSDKKCSEVNDSSKEYAQSEFSMVKNHDNVSSKECAQSEYLKIKNHNNETVGKGDQEINSEVREIVTGLLNDICQTTKLKDDATDRKIDTPTFLHSEDTCHKLFGSPLSVSSHSSSGSGSESDSDSSYSSHSSDCSTCSSYSSDSGSSSDSDSEEEDEENNKTNPVNHQSHKTVNESIKQANKEQNSKASFNIKSLGNKDKTNKAFSHTSDENNEMLMEESNYMETDDLDMQPKVTAKTSTKRSPVKKGVATVSTSGSKLNQQTLGTPVLRNFPNIKSVSITKEVGGRDDSNPSGGRNRACRNKSGDGSSNSSSTRVSPQTPNPYLIEDETPEFLIIPMNNAKSSNSHLPRDSTSSTSPKDGVATPAAKFASPKKFHAVNSSAVRNSCLGVISSVDNNKLLVSKSKSLPAVSSISGKTDGRTNGTSKENNLKTDNEDKCKQLKTTESKSRNNSQQSKITDFNDYVVKESSSVPVKTKSGTVPVKTKSGTVPVKTKSGFESNETKSSSVPVKINSGCVPVKTKSGFEPCVPKSGTVPVKTKSGDVTVKTKSEAVPLESSCRKLSVTYPSSANQKKDLKPIAKCTTQIEKKTPSESQEKSKNQVTVEEEISVPKQVLRRSPRKKCSVSHTSLSVNGNEKKPVTSDRNSNKDRIKGIAGELFGQALSGCTSKLPANKNKSDSKTCKPHNTNRKSSESRSEVDTSRSRKTSESRPKVNTNRSNKTFESRHEVYDSKSRKTIESRFEIDRTSAKGKNVKKTNVSESFHKQSNNEMVGKKSDVEKTHGKSSAGNNLRKSVSDDKQLLGKTMNQQSNAERTRTPSGDKQKPRTPSGDVQKSRKQSGDVQKSRKQSGDVQKSRTQSGDVQKSRTQSGDVQKSRKQSGDVHKQLDCKAFVELTDCKSIDNQSTEESILRQSNKNMPVGHTEIMKCSSNVRTRNTSGLGKDSKTSVESSKSKSIESVRLNKKGNVTENRKKHPSSTLPSPLKKFTIPKLKRKASTSPDDLKIREKRRKPLQTVSPTKSPSPICLKRTRDGQWSKTKSKSNTLRLSDIVDSSSSDESSEGSSIINALFGSCSDDKDAKSNETVGKSAKDSNSVKDSGSVKGSASKEQLATKKGETTNKNKELTSQSLNKDNITKPVPPVLFLDEHTMDRTDYEDMLCLDNCEDTFDDDLSTCSSSGNDSNEGLEDGELSSASESENKTQPIPAVSKTKSVKTPQKKSGPKNMSSKTNNNCDKTRTNNTTSTTRKFDEGSKGTEITRIRYNDRRSPNYRRRGRYRSRSPIDFKRSSRSSYDRDRKYSRNDPHFSPRDRRVRTPNKRRRSVSRNRDSRDSDSFREKRRNTSTRS